MPTDYGAVSTQEQDGETPGAFRKSRRCNDVLFGLAFWIHIGLVIYAWVSYETQDIDVDYADRGVWKFIGTCGAVALILSTLSLFFMTVFTDELVEIALLVSLLCTAAVTAYGFYVWKIYMMVLGSLALLASIVFTCSVWKRIPFAAANLKTAIRAIRTNFGLIFLSYTLEVVAFGWLILWFDACGASMSTQGVWIVFIYLLSFFWTEQIINNLQHTIVASMIGTWWYNPTDANFCWDDGLNRSICHSLTYSFGSICFGSFFAAIVQALKWVHRISSRPTNRCARCVTACIDCVLSCVQEAIEYFNKWAFTFVGIHGDSYISSGRQVVALFKQRGWSSLVGDILADMVMMTMKMSIALISALVGWWLVKKDDDIFVGVGVDPKDDDAVGFVAGGLIGYMIASIMMELVGSAVNAVIVCFAEAPDVFQNNYKELCDEMLEAWKKAYPSECSDDFSSIKV